MPDRSRSTVNGFSLDHVLFGGSDLELLQESFDTAGLRPEYGGVHSNANTHNAVLGFDDGSYIELIAPVDLEKPISRRATLLRNNAGPCGWALEAPDLDRSSRELADRGLMVDGPITMDRTRPDGVTLEWELSILGEEAAGSCYPFLIEDHTPRTGRITPTDSVSETELCGIAAILLGTADPVDLSERFVTAFDLPSPTTDGDLTTIDATVTAIPGTALGFVSPTRSDSPLAQRINHFGDIPRSFLLTSTDFEVSLERFPVSGCDTYQGRRVAWLELEGALPGSIGILEAASDPL